MRFFTLNASKKNPNPVISISCFTGLQSFILLCHTSIYIFFFHSSIRKYQSECIAGCAYLIFRFATGTVWSCIVYYISTTGLLNPARKCIVTPDDEQDDLISCISRDICADEGAQCIRPPFPFFYSLSWNQSYL